MTSTGIPHFDLQDRSNRAMLQYGFEASFSAEASSQADHEVQEASSEAAVSGIRDLRHLLWSSIDNRDSMDLDQIEVAEQLANGVIRITVGISDVDSHVPRNSAIDSHALHNKCSVYTGVGIYPMLPEPLSNDLTSLKQDADRLAVIVSMDISPLMAV